MSTAPTTNPTPRPPLGAVFGTARCGSTWLGSIINTHPQVAYRFEPFRRHRGARALIAAGELLKSDALTDGSLQQVYDALRPAWAMLDKPPFFTKDNTLNFAKRFAWPPARVTKLLDPAFRALYSPRGTPPLVFKEVNQNVMMKRLLARTTAPVVYLVRHPCGVVASLARGYEQGVMRPGRQLALRDWLTKEFPDLAPQFVPRLEAMPPLQKEALLWRLELTEAVAATRHHPRALLVGYEALCDDPLAQATRVLHHLQLQLPDATRAYLAMLTSTAGPDATGSGEVLKSNYFTVFRNPAATRDQWKKKVSPDQQRDIMAIVEPCDAFHHCAALAHWN